MCEGLEGSGSQGERDKVLCHPYVKLWLIVKPEQALEELSDPQALRKVEAQVSGVHGHPRLK